jgi:hypothetical protein
MGGEVLLKGQPCLLRFHPSLTRNSLKPLVILFRGGADFPM